MMTIMRPISRMLGLRLKITGFHVLILGLIFVVSMLIVRHAAGQVAETTGGVSILDLNIGNSPGFIRETIVALGENGRVAYLRFYLVDTFYPLTYAIFYSSWMVILLRHCRTGHNFRHLKALPALPWIAAVFDWLENITISSLLLLFPRDWQPLYVAASFATIAKFSAIALAVGGIVILLGNYLVQKIMHHRAPR
ncbi:hypothetical protein ACSL103130_04585 [Actinomyces slackii]|uniref:Uncharacterized protein n=2 Tax=Actinomyces slackii TaxID=52774 RepID=A0A448KEQ4_9ACTO|nr:Uncharacterised protein [Actinomyces slackii]